MSNSRAEPGRGSPRTERFHGATFVGAEVTDKFVPEKTQSIYWPACSLSCELLAALTPYPYPYTSLRERFKGRQAIHWIDHTSAIAALCKGYSAANGGKSQLGRYWEDKFSSRKSSNEKKSTGRSLSGLCSLPCLLLALKAQWQVPETGHGPHRRSFRVFNKSAKTSQQTSTLCSSVRLSGAPDVENISSRGAIGAEGSLASA
eukprot:scaffold1557_cov108-Isochrysis_galbana.AAC.15